MKRCKTVFSKGKKSISKESGKSKMKEDNICLKYTKCPITTRGNDLLQTLPMKNKILMIKATKYTKHKKIKALTQRKTMRILSVTQ